MLHWFNFFGLLLLINILSLFISQQSVLFLLLQTELLIICLVFLFLVTASYFHITFLIGFGLCYLILGGMEIALNLLLLTKF